LGGDSDHSILVKGLDFALLEQNKAKAAAASTGVDDESLEQAFLEVTSAVSESAPSTTVPRKRTREDLIKELKEKRGNPGVQNSKEKDIGIEEAKKAGKFKPIGFKPVGNSDKKETKKKDKQEKGQDKQRKKRKMNSEQQTVPTESENPLPPLPLSKVNLTVKEPEPEPLASDFDIFADAEEYAGLEIDDDDEMGSENGAASDHKSDPGPSSPVTRPKWFDEPKEPTPPPPIPELPVPKKEPIREDIEEEQPMRLVPLASSAVPSIKDILAIDQAAEKEEKRKARKEKRKEKKELTTEGKANRDYQKLMAYEKKKAK